ncbi:unnamed protein product, partial [Ectocarpus sp. 12 AP-2014]
QRHGAPRCCWGAISGWELGALAALLSVHYIAGQHAVSAASKGGRGFPWSRRRLVASAPGRRGSRRLRPTPRDFAAQARRSRVCGRRRRRRRRRFSEELRSNRSFGQQQQQATATGGVVGGAVFAPQEDGDRVVKRREARGSSRRRNAKDS